MAIPDRHSSIHPAFMIVPGGRSTALMFDIAVPTTPIAFLISVLSGDVRSHILVLEPAAQRPETKPPSEATSVVSRSAAKSLAVIKGVRDRRVLAPAAWLRNVSIGNHVGPACRIAGPPTTASACK